jgi:hypothetical protein
VRHLGRSNNGRQQWAVSLLEFFSIDPQTGVQISVPNGLVLPGHKVISAAGSPVDDRILLATSFGNTEYQLAIAHTQGGETKTVPIPEDCYPYVMAWNAQGTRFAVTWLNTPTGLLTTELWEPSHPSRIAVLPDGSSGSGMKFSPDGHRLCLQGLLVRTDTGAKVADLGNWLRVVSGAGWSPDSRHMVLCSEQGTHGELELIKTTNDFVVADDSLPLLRNMGAAWSPEGKLISGSNQDSLVRTWRSRDGKWQSAWTSVQLPGDDWATFSAGGRLLSSSASANRHLVAVVERSDGVIETRPYLDFAAANLPLPPLKPVDPKAEREVANTLLDLKADFSIRSGEQVLPITDVGQLPNGDFTIQAVNLAAHHRVRESELRFLANCRRLESLSLSGLPIGDTGLAVVAELPSLTTLNLSGLQSVHPAGLQILSGLPRLTTLTLAVEVDTAALKAVAKLPKLEWLVLLGVTGSADFSVLSGCPRLRQLVIAGSVLETQSAADWTRVRALETLQIQGPTPQAVAIAAALPQLTTLDIYGNGDSVTPEVLAAIARMRTVRRLNIISESPVASAAWLELRWQLPDSILLFAQGKEILPGLPEPPPAKGLSFDGRRCYVHVPSLKFDPQQTYTVEVECVAEPIFLAPSQTLFSWASSRFHVDFARARQPVDPPFGEWQAAWFSAGRDDRALICRTLPKPLPELLLRRTHLAAVRDGERLTLFVNGRRESTDSEPGPVYQQKGSSEIFVIGTGMRADNPLYTPFAGVIERLRVSKAARYADDYEPPAEYAVDADTLALYRFDEGQGSKLNDASGNGHHGTIVNATWVDTTK